jgi:hypothetical protein
MSINAVAMELKVSVSWVYANAHLLGTKLGGMWFFTKEGLEDAIRRREPVEGSGQTSRVKDKGNKAVGNKKTGRAMGKGPGEGDQDSLIVSARRHGLIDLHGKIS